MHKFENLNLKIFLVSNGDAEKLFVVGEKNILKCYDRQFDEFRYNAYVEKDLHSRKPAVNLALLLPTKDAATQHISMISISI